MKKIVSITSALTFLVSHLFGQSQTDSASIRETSLNYIEGFYMSDYKRVEKAVHPELAKRVILKDGNGNFLLRNMGSSELIFNAKNFKKPEDKSSDAFRATVAIYDISHDIALVKITQNKMKFIDYLHLGKFNGEWKIINVLWAKTE